MGDLNLPDAAAGQMKAKTEGAFGYAAARLGGPAGTAAERTAKATEKTVSDFWAALKRPWIAKRAGIGSSHGLYLKRGTGEIASLICNS